MSGKRIQVLTLVLYVVLALALLWQNRELAALRGTLEQTRERMLKDYANIVLRLSDAEKHIEKLDTEPKKTELVRSYAIDIQSVDLGERTVTFSVAAELTLADEHAGASVIADAAEHHGAVETALVRGENGRYTGAVTLPLEPDDKIQLRLLASAGGVKYTQTLCAHYSIMELMPVRLNIWSGDASYEDGTLIWSGWTFAPKDPQGNPADVAEARMELSAGGAPPVAVDLAESSYVQTPDSIGMDCGEGDTVAVSFTCVDQYGLRYAFSAGWWEIRDGTAVRHWPSVTRPDLLWE